MHPLGDIMFGPWYCSTAIALNSLTICNLPQISPQVNHAWTAQCASPTSAGPLDAQGVPAFALNRQVLPLHKNVLHKKTLNGKKLHKSSLHKSSLHKEGRGAAVVENPQPGTVTARHWKKALDWKLFFVFHTADSQAKISCITTKNIT